MLISEVCKRRGLDKMCYISPESNLKWSFASKRQLSQVKERELTARKSLTALITEASIPLQNSSC